MSRIGNDPLQIPDGVEFVFKNKIASVKGKLGTLEQEINANLDVTLKDAILTLTAKDTLKETRARHGLYRKLIENMVIGVSQGYKKSLQLIGVGYSAKLNGAFLELNLGYSHLIYFEIPQELKCETVVEKGKPPTVVLSGYDKQLLGLVASKIRALRKPEPYRGKGVRYSDEIVRRKAGKSAQK